MSEIKATDEGGQPVEVVDRPTTEPASSTANESNSEKNPLGEPEIRVRVKPGFEFFNMGEKVRENDEFNMPISQAREASRYVLEVLPDGNTRSVQPEATSGVIPRANLSGLARHERISALAEEEQQLEARLTKVREAREHEEQAAAASRKEPSVPPAQPAPGTVNSTGPVSPNPAFQPGTEGAVGNTAVPPRPGEPSTGSGGTPTANRGPIAKK